MTTVVTEKFYYKTELRKLTSISSEENQAKAVPVKDKENK